MASGLTVRSLAAVHALIRFAQITAFLLGPAALVLQAAGPGVGATRAEVVAQFGQPRAVLSGGSREILTYPSGRVVLENGLVTKMEMPPPAPAAIAVAPAPRVAPAPAPPPQATATREVWLTDFAEAKREALSSKRRILALFTGSDWCPACMEFENQVAHHPDFLATTQTSFVLLKLDYPQARIQSPETRAQNSELRKRFGIASYPTLLILSAEGEKLQKVENTKPRQASDVTDFYVQAVDEARRRKPDDSKWWWPF